MREHPLGEGARGFTVPDLLFAIFASFDTWDGAAACVCRPLERSTAWLHVRSARALRPRARSVPPMYRTGHRRPLERSTEWLHVRSARALRPRVRSGLSLPCVQ